LIIDDAHAIAAIIARIAPAALRATPLCRLPPFCCYYAPLFAAAIFVPLLITF